MKFTLLVVLTVCSFQAFANASVKCKDGKIYPLVTGDIDPTPEAEKKCKENKGVEMIMIHASPSLGGGMMSPPKPSQGDQ